MPDKPSAEVEITAGLVRGLIRAQAPHLAELAQAALRHEADGWDCSVWRLGEDLAVRLPRRALAAPLVQHEQQVLPAIAARLAASGLGVPAPVIAGRPGSGYPWSWSVVPWFDGDAGLRIPRHLRTGWALPLSEALRRLHVAAAPDHPVNPFRGVPLAARAGAVAGRLNALERRLSPPRVRALRAIWDAALDAPVWSGPALWIHGDLHPGNLIARADRLVAVIDFGDVTAGDPAYDLSVAWTAFDRAGRTAFRGALSELYDEATWRRARGWAAAVASLLVEQSDDDPLYAALGAEVVDELAGEANTGGADPR